MITAPPLPDIDQVVPLSDDDDACIREIREVLLKHNRSSRFGLTLLHQHFPIAPDEVLLETCDSETRTLTIKPVKRSELDRPVQTNWRLDVPQATAHCQQVCQPYEDYNTKVRGHNRLHNRVG